MIPTQLIPHFTRDLRNPGELYRVAKEIDNRSEEGSFNLATLRAMKYYFLPYRQCFYEPLSTRVQLKELADVGYTLREAYVPDYMLPHAVVSFRCFESVRTAPKGRLSLPKPGEVEIEGHAVAMAGWDYSDDSLLFINSWGRRWGDNGFGSLSPEYIDQYLIDAWLGGNARYGWTFEKARRNLSPLAPKEFAREWALENPRWRKRFSHNGRRHQWVLYEALSITGCPVEVIDVRNEIGLRVGWTHLFHEPDIEKERRMSVLKELYVWPSFRRQGYGRLLESMAIQRARDWKSTKAQILFHNIDSFTNVRRAGRIFAERQGYAWKWRSTIRPITSAVGEKPLYP